MKLTLYSSQQCHLCDIALGLLSDTIELNSFKLEKVDVKTDPQLFHLYGARIPVLKRHDTNLELAWPFDQQQLVEFLA